MKFDSINPSTGEVIASYEEHSREQVEQFLAGTAAAQKSWARLSFAERAAPLKRAATNLRRDREKFARLMALEMGKPLDQGRSETDKCATGCDFFADRAEEFLRDEEIKTDASRSFVAFQPLGTLLAIMPWNFPLWQVFRAAAPALMAGNALVLKHASNVFGCALEIERIFAEAGFPEHIFRTLLIGSKRVDELIAHPVVSAVTLTGSTAAGKAVAAKAGNVLKKAVLELGGSDAYVILEDADVELAAETCVTSRLINSGQSCIAAKRFIAVRPVRKQFEELVVEKMRARKVGDPLQPGVQVGPLARKDLRDALHEQVERSIAGGAKLLLGGKILDGRGAFYPPTVLTDVRKGIAAFDEETFGPVAAIIEAADEREAIELANDSQFGLGGAVFTRDLGRGERIAATQLQAGSCFVNDFVRSDPRLPFGGIKESGFGRELSHFGIQEFVNVKTVYIR